MIYLEAILLTILLFVCCYSTVTDIRNGTIHNKQLLIAGLSGGLVNAIYYHSFAKEYFIAFVINFLLLSTISIVFYGYHIWAGGDSKLLIIVALLIPGRIYGIYQSQAATGLSILIFTFAIAFTYLIIETIAISVKDKNRIAFKLLSKSELIKLCKQYLYCLAYIVAFYRIVLFLLPSTYSLNTSLLLFVNMIFILTIIKFDLFKPALFVGSIALILISEILTGFHGINFPDLKIFVLLIVLILLRKVAYKQNYQEIPTDEVIGGMVMSFATVAIFSNSRIQGLPHNTTEDLSSRITLNEADRIRHWGQSKKGKSTIVIVRKMPFAVFITIGTFIFILIRVFTSGI